MAEQIKFYKGEETGIVHESYKEKETSLFKDQYNKALSEINAYLSANSDRDSNENNIFAFIGDRGTGKTSCMESVAQMLCDIHLENESSGIFKKSNTIYQEAIENKSYLILDTVDPTTFERNVNILDVVIGVLFERVQQKIECSDRCLKSVEEYEKAKQDLFDAFQKVKECLKFIKKPELLISDDDDISQIADMASVSRLKNRMEKLTDKFLAFFKSDVLVIAIDDIDLQSKHAYDMMEQLRKYFMFKNVIILMAFKYEQMLKVLAREFTKDYFVLIKSHQLTASSIEEMATKYLTKLVPTTRRVYMPTFEVYADVPISYYTYRREYSHNNASENSTLIYAWESVKYAVTSLIYQKCRFLFYHSRGVVSPIVPRNLRELRQLLADLVDMDDYSKENPNYNNKSRFLTYFYNMWIQNNISSNDIHIINAIKNTKDVGSINKTVIQLLKDKYLETFFDIEAFSEIFSEKNVSYNVSIADVYAVVNYIDQRVENIKDRNLLFFIKSHYSILLYRYYDQITEKHQSYYRAPKIEDEFDRRVDDSIRQRERIDEFSNYEVLIGGTFINTDIYSLLPIEWATNLSRDHRYISFNALSNLAKNIVDGSALRDNNWLLCVWLVEFFALCTSRILDSRNAVNKKVREHDDVSYTYRFNNQNDSLLFDLGAFFFNITNIKKSYIRINPQLFKLAEITKDSLYNKLLARCQDIRGWREDREDISKYAMLSCVCIRNFEVLSDFINEIQYGWKDRSPGESNIDNLIRFFDNVKKFYIHTYDKEDVKFDEKLYTDNIKKRLSESTDVEEIVEDEINKQVDLVANKITFEYADVVSEVLNKVKNTNVDLFNSIYSENLVEKALKGITNKFFSIQRLKTTVTNNLKNEFKNVSIKQAWENHPLFQGNIKGKKIKMRDARGVLEQFIKDNKLG